MSAEDLKSSPLTTRANQLTMLNSSCIKYKYYQHNLILPCPPPACARALPPLSKQLVPPGGTGEEPRALPPNLAGPAHGTSGPRRQWQLLASIRNRQGAIRGSTVPWHFNRPCVPLPFVLLPLRQASARWAGSTVGEPVEVMKRFRGACSFSTWFASGMIIPHRHPSSA